MRSNLLKFVLVISILCISALPAMAMSKKQEAVKAWLGKLELPQYFDVFVSSGFDSMTALCSASVHDFQALGIKRHHEIVLMRAIGQLNKEMDEAAKLAAQGSEGLEKLKQAEVARQEAERLKAEGIKKEQERFLKQQEVDRRNSELRHRGRMELIADQQRTESAEKDNEKKRRTLQGIIEEADRARQEQEKQQQAVEAQMRTQYQADAHLEAFARQAEEEKQNKQMLKKFLQECGLEEFLDGLWQTGIKSLEQLKLASQVKLVRAGIENDVQRDLLRQRLVALRNDAKEIERPEQIVPDTDYKLFLQEKGLFYLHAKLVEAGVKNFQMLSSISEEHMTEAGLTGSDQLALAKALHSYSKRGGEKRNVAAPKRPEDCEQIKFFVEQQGMVKYSEVIAARFRDLQEFLDATPETFIEIGLPEKEAKSLSDAMDASFGRVKRKPAIQASIRPNDEDCAQLFAFLDKIELFERFEVLIEKGVMTTFEQFLKNTNVLTYIDAGLTKKEAERIVNAIHTYNLQKAK